VTSSERGWAPVRPLVLCTVGTDHHQFDRLVRWCDSFAAAHPATAVFVQYGSSAPPQVAAGEAYWDKDQLALLLSGAHVVITHGGPGSIGDARRAGTRPIVIPRDPARGEHVDDHQIRFVARLASRGLVVAVGSEAELHKAVRRQLTSPRGSGVDREADDARVRASALRFGALVERLVSQPRR